MRPLSLEVEGFSTFRERAVVNFDDVDVFAFVGPTGSGKSSLIDAMVFALYGAVPRLDKRLVYPVITQGLSQCRVRFDFAIGSRSYTVVRVVRRNAKGTGATTPEARLQCGDEVLAGSARELDAEVERLLGLSFAQFTTCVVLPQGEFARLLHDTASSRQDLLVRLLDLGAYARIGKAARARATSADSQLALVRGSLDRIEPADLVAVDRLSARLAELAGVAEQVASIEPVLAELALGRSTAEVARARAGAQIAKLEALAIPPAAGDLDAQIKAVQAEAALAAADEEASLVLLDRARAATADLAERSLLLTWQAARERLAGLAAQLEKGEQALQAARAAVTDARAVVEATADRRQEAERALDAARVRDRAAHLRHEISLGERCPVCDQEVLALPPPADVDVAGVSDAEAVARSAHDLAVESLREATTEVDRVLAKLASVGDGVTQADAELVGAPDSAGVAAGLAAWDSADQAIGAAQAAHREARLRRQQADDGRSRLAGAEAGAWRQLDAARDELSDLRPPAVAREDLAGAWQVLIEWAESAVPELRAEHDSEAEAVADLAARAAALTAELDALCRSAGVEVEHGSEVRRSVEAAITDTRVELARMEERQAERERLTAQRDELQVRHEVAALLGRLLRSDGFEKWLLDEAFEVLLAGATESLRALSGQQYSLALDDKREQFVVIDHFAADERRLARTLSGGETFLASLALALSLSDQVAQLSADGAPRLESIFLDEGFGTLDPDTLEVVATTIEALGASGRMVGLVSHVRELAERVPVRFEVRKGPTTSTVERIDR